MLCYTIVTFYKRVVMFIEKKVAEYRKSLGYYQIVTYELIMSD